MGEVTDEPPAGRDIAFTGAVGGRSLLVPHQRDGSMRDARRTGMSAAPIATTDSRTTTRRASKGRAHRHRTAATPGDRQWQAPLEPRWRGPVSRFPRRLMSSAVRDVEEGYFGRRGGWRAAARDRTSDRLHDASARLLLTEGGHRIHAHGGKSRAYRGRDGDDQDYQRSARKHRRIVRVDSVQDAGEHH